MKKASHVNHLAEYGKALKVLDSCENQTHVKGARRYFALYLNKWKHMFDSNEISSIEVDFKILVAKKLSELIPA